MVSHLEQGQEKKLTFVGRTSGFIQIDLYEKHTGLISLIDEQGWLLLPTWQHKCFSTHSGQWRSVFVGGEAAEQDLTSVRWVWGNYTGSWMLLWFSDGGVCYRGSGVYWVHIAIIGVWANPFCGGWKQLCSVQKTPKVVGIHQFVVPLSEKCYADEETQAANLCAVS